MVSELIVHASPSDTETPPTLTVVFNFSFTIAPRKLAADFRRFIQIRIEVFEFFSFSLICDYLRKSAAHTPIAEFFLK